jgi:hypothetical protein
MTLLKVTSDTTVSKSALIFYEAHLILDVRHMSEPT